MKIGVGISGLHAAYTEILLAEGITVDSDMSLAVGIKIVAR